MVTRAHHTTKQTGKAHRRVLVRHEACRSYKLLLSLPPSEGQVREKQRKQLPVQRDVKEHEVSSGDKATIPKMMKRKGNSFNATS